MKSDCGYSMTIEEFLAKGYKFEPGDEVHDIDGLIKMVGDPSVWMLPAPLDNSRYIKKSSQLEREDLHQYMSVAFDSSGWIAIPRLDVCEYVDQIAIDRQQYIKEFNSETKMKPFNLERALAGDKVITRDGQEVTQLTRFDLGNGDEYLVGVVGGELKTFYTEGIYCASREEIAL